MGVIIGSFFRQVMRDSRHLKEQKEGRQLIARRLGIPGAVWQPEMVNYPSFVCAHCQFPHILRQTLLGCSFCAAPYLPSEAMSRNKDGRMTCIACTAEQKIADMPFCCVNCRCIQGVPARLDWRRTFTPFPAWRSFIGPMVPTVFGLLALLACIVSSQVNPTRHSDDRIVLGIFFGLIPLAIGVIALLVLLFRKKMPAELMLSCGGFGILTKEGPERWFSWQAINGLEARQPSGRRGLIFDTSPAAQPDSTASRWAVHTAQEVVFFDLRIQNAEELAHQIRMRAPAAALVDLPTMARPSPWIVVAIAIIMMAFAGAIAVTSMH